MFSETVVQRSLQQTLLWFLTFLAHFPPGILLFSVSSTELRSKVRLPKFQLFSNITKDIKGISYNIRIKISDASDV